MRNWIVWWWKIIKQYLSNCSIHGVKYLVNEQLSAIERIFWLIFCALSWWGCAIMIKDVIGIYINKPVEVTAESLYLDWVTPFPSVAFCITSNNIIRKKYFKQCVSHNSYMLMKLMSANELLLNPGTIANYSFPVLSKASAEDLLDIYDQIKAPCTEFMGRCSWNNVNFNCCTEFEELYKTGVGHCFAINSVHLKKGINAVKLAVNRSVKYGDLVVDIIVNEATKKYFSKSMEIYFLNNLQAPLITTTEENHKMKMKSDQTTRIEFTIYGVYNEDGVKNVDIEQRACRFRDETLEGSIFDIYTTDACKLEAIIGRMIKFCGCVHFFYLTPPGARVCSMEEMQCIIANKTEIVLFKTHECSGSCSETTLIVNRQDPWDYDPPPKGFSRIHFTMLAHPTIRFRRYVSRDLLTVVVSVGSALGLFTGASILSIFEVPYWLFVRRDRIS